MPAQSTALFLSLLEHFPDTNVSSSVQCKAHHMALSFNQPYAALQKEQTWIVLSCLSTLFKSMKLSLSESDGVFQASKEETFLSTLTHSNVTAAEIGIHLPPL